MRSLVVIGVILILVGVAGLLVNVVPIHHTEQVAKIGPLTANADKETDIVIPPYVGIIVILVGGALVFAGRRRV